MIIDVHNHANYQYHNKDKIVDNMNRHGIDVTWLHSWEGQLDEWCPDNAKEFTGFTPEAAAPFKYCVEAKEKYPDRFVLAYCPNPRDPFAIDKMDAAVNTYGVQVCGEWKFRMMLDNWDCIDLYRYCGERNIPVLFHLEYPLPTHVKYPRPHWWYAGTMETVERTLELCPETKFIGHAMGFWADISGDGLSMKEVYPKGKVVEGGKLIKALRKYPNLYCDISGTSGLNGISRDPEFTKEFFDEFQDRILFGRDLYIHNKHLEFIQSIDIPESIRRKILGENALKLVPLRG